MPKKLIHVVAAVICKENSVLATRRGSGEFINKWEFPGGKIEVGETPEEALRREIWEELQVYINVRDFIMTAAYSYPNFDLRMDHENIDLLDWLPADLEVVRAVKTKLLKMDC